MSDDLGFDFTSAVPWFPHDKEDPYVLVRVSEEHAASWANALGIAVRRCYVSDSIVTARATELGVDESEIIAARMPEAGSTMTGDFGEILVYLYLCAKNTAAFGPKKWRLKQDRTKPAPHTDVVHFVLPKWPQASDEDKLLCSEVKTKSGKSKFNPIADAITDATGTKKKKGRTSHLMRTLMWLRERALVESLGEVQIAHLERFINATEHPEAKKEFRAVAVICKTLVDSELEHAPEAAVSDYTLVVIAVPDLKSTYSAVFESATKAVPSPPATVRGVAAK